jgi:hypothetical protein
MQAEWLPPLQPNAGELQYKRKASAAQRAAAIMALGAGQPWWATQLADVRAGIMAHHRRPAAGGSDASAVQAGSQATGPAGQAAGLAVGVGHAGQAAAAVEGGGRCVRRRHARGLAVQSSAVWFPRQEAAKGGGAGGGGVVPHAAVATVAAVWVGKWRGAAVAAGAGARPWWCPSVNSFQFQPCDHTPPGFRKIVGS